MTGVRFIVGAVVGAIGMFLFAPDTRGGRLRVPITWRKDVELEVFVWPGYSGEQTVRFLRRALALSDPGEQVANTTASVWHYGDSPEGRPHTFSPHESVKLCATCAAIALWHDARVAAGG